MRRLIVIVLFILSILTDPITVYAETPLRPCTVIAEFPHNQNSSTQGLFFHKGILYESSGGYGRSFLAKVELSTGRHLQNLPLDNKYFAEGMAPSGDTFRLLTWRSGTGFTYYLDNLRQHSSFAYRKQFETTEGWGLTFDSEEFILSSGTDSLSFYTEKDFTRIRTINVTDNGKAVRLLNELEYVNGLIYANIWKSDVVIVIDPESGQVRGRIDLSPLRKRLSEDCGVANGIAIDTRTNRLYVTGKHWNKLFEIEIPHF
ncbi:glutaminyl-peptide cyclotransferase [uncultured Pseudodesulfovibrio sp.]|uniref:glutaminyl-peptide cyclotransferase n=1 Tax=uncultured Pseudodesulfovibrio sp. TaxID=2035858 RepID=UPI0029C8F3BD|nr:glutaminyl-peptide cyclotransferase [uncultured Pseudodesulfovibrio sp.]